VAGRGGVRATAGPLRRTLYPVPYLLGWFTWTETRYFLVAALAVVVLTLEFLRLVVGFDHALQSSFGEYETDSIAGYARTR